VNATSGALVGGKMAAAVLSAEMRSSTLFPQFTRRTFLLMPFVLIVDSYLSLLNGTAEGPVTGDRSILRWVPFLTSGIVLTIPPQVIPGSSGRQKFFSNPSLGEKARFIRSAFLARWVGFRFSQRFFSFTNDRIRPVIAASASGSPDGARDRLFPLSSLKFQRNVLFLTF